MKYILLFTSIFLLLSISDGFLMWAVMEMNMYVFIWSFYSVQKMNLALTYFIPQSVSSLFFLMWFLSFKTSNFYSLFLLLGMLLKLGVFPFHHWMVSMLNFLNWKLSFLLLSVQKIAPSLILFVYSFSFLWLISLCSTFSMVLLFQKQTFKGIFIASSISMSAWFLCMMVVCVQSWVTFFFMTFFILLF